MDKKQVRYLVLSVVFVLLWFAFLVPYLSQVFEDYISRFFIFTVLPYFILFVFLKAITRHEKITAAKTVGSLLGLIAFGIWTGYNVHPDGTIIEGGFLGNASPGIFIASILDAIGLSGIPLFVIHTLIPALFIVASYYLLKDKEY